MLLESDLKLSKDDGNPPYTYTHPMPPCSQNFPCATQRTINTQPLACAVEVIVNSGDVNKDGQLVYRLCAFYAPSFDSSCSAHCGCEAGESSIQWQLCDAGSSFRLPSTWSKRSRRCTTPPTRTSETRLRLTRNRLREYRMPRNYRD